MTEPVGRGKSGRAAMAEPPQTTTLRRLGAASTRPPPYPIHMLRSVWVAGTSWQPTKAALSASMKAALPYQ